MKKQYINVICGVFILNIALLKYTSASCPHPPNFLNVPLSTTNYVNWAQEISASNFLVATPQNEEDVVTIANWAYLNNYKIRAKGYSHNWSPILVEANDGGCKNIILVDTTLNLINVQIGTVGGVEAVTAQSGLSLENLLTYLEERSLGILGHPAPGDITLGGALAIGAHGTGVPLNNNSQNYGTLTNLILSFKAIAWNNITLNYEIKTFNKGDVDTKYVLLSLGRIFITEVTLQVFPLSNVLCQSYTNLNIKDLFADPRVNNNSNKMISKYIETSGAIEVILFPFTNFPWLKVWTISPTKPLLARKVSSPYNYPFSDNIPTAVSDLAERIVAGEWNLAPTLGATSYTITTTGLVATLSSTIWGPSKNTFLYVKPTTLRVTANGYALITQRANVQLVLSQFYEYYSKLLVNYTDNGMYPINGPLEVRVTGVDMGQNAPSISPLRQVENRTDLDTAIWLDILTFPSTPFKDSFYTQIQDFLLNSFDPGINTLRLKISQHWSKGYAYTPLGAWTDLNFIQNKIPNSFGVAEWNRTVEALNKIDPIGIFTNGYLSTLLQSYSLNSL